MRLSTKGEYGVRVMAELARHFGEGPTSLSEVAQSQGLSLDYLEQIIAPLRKASLVTSTRGAKGGYVLAKSPEAITLGEIVRTLEGSLAPVKCVSEGGEEQLCLRAEECTSRVVWKKVRDGIAQVLDSTTLSDIA